MDKLRIQHWENDESVVYNTESGDMHLLSFSNAELLGLMVNKMEQTPLVSKIANDYQVDNQEAKLLLNNLCIEYRKLHLID